MLIITMSFDVYVKRNRQFQPAHYNTLLIDHKVLLCNGQAPMFRKRADYMGELLAN